jgi:hypothetical protein
MLSVGGQAVKKKVGQVRRNETEEIHISLKELHGELHVEMRVYGRSARHGGAYLPEPEAIAVPVHALLDLCHVLEQTHDSLLKEGLVKLPSLMNMISIGAGDPVTLQPAPQPDAPPEAPRGPQVAVKLPFECVLMGAPESWPSTPLPERVTGQIRVLSVRGARVWLPAQFPACCHLAIFLRVGKIIFRGQAEVVEVESHPKNGNYRHRLEWRSLSPQAQAALSKIITAPK